MSSKTNNFIEPIISIENLVVKGCRGIAKVRFEGTFIWKIEYGYGKVHSIIIQNINYVPEEPTCPLSPHQWAQKATNNHPTPDVTRCNSKDQNCIIYWEQEK